MNASGRPTKLKRHGDHHRELMVQVGAPNALGDVGIPPGANYADVFVLTGRFSEYPLDDWARALFEQTAGRTGQFLWRRVLRLKLVRPPDSRRARPGHQGDEGHGTDGTPFNDDTLGSRVDWIAGWRVAQRGQDWVRLEAFGTLLSGNLVVRVEHQQVLLGTCVSYKTRFGGWLWRQLAPIHQRAAPGLLREGLANLIAQDR